MASFTWVIFARRNRLYANAQTENAAAQSNPSRIIFGGIRLTRAKLDGTFTGYETAYLLLRKTTILIVDRAVW